MRVLLSVYDKTGLTALASGLVALGAELVSSGGTSRALDEAGIACTPVERVTGAPEMLGGRVKTLHPRIAGGILADRSKAEHVADLAAQGIDAIDLVVCNLYPFESTVASDDVSEDEAVEQIDIGGPAMVRAAAKNWRSVTVIVTPDRYESVLEELRGGGAIGEETRRSLALEAFSHTAAYDAAIAAYLRGRGAPPDGELPFRFELSAAKAADLRYGENPHQRAAFYATGEPRSGLAAVEQLGGKELSYNNLLDTDAAWRLASELPGTGAVIVKHSNPCGVALRESLSGAYVRAWQCDKTSAFGGIVALTGDCDGATADAISKVFTEVVIAPSFSAEALDILRAKKNLRLLRAPFAPSQELEVRRVAGGLLVQSSDPRDDASGAQCVTKAVPSEEQLADLGLAWIVVKHVKSNAVVLVKEGAAVGVGAGQMSRVEAVELAAHRAGKTAAGSVLASDAFFPFRDGVDAAIDAGASAIAQPGGSVRDDEVIAAANERGVAMLFTGKRHFRH